MKLSSKDAETIFKVHEYLDNNPGHSISRAAREVRVTVYSYNQAIKRREQIRRAPKVIRRSKVSE